MPLLKQTSTDALASAARQLDYALQQSPTLDDAFQKLYATADERRQSTLKQLEGLLRSRESDSTASKTLRLSSYPTLKWLLSQATAPERSVAALLQDFRRHESFSATTTAVVWSEFAGFLTYLGAVLGVLIVVVLLYGIIILPQFRSLYGGFGRELPGFTQLVFGSGAWFFTLLLLGSLALLIFLSWFVCLLRSRLRRYVPIPARLQRVPFVGPVALAYNEYLWVSYARLLRTTGISAVQALRLAAQRLLFDHVERRVTSDGDTPPYHTRKQSALAADIAVAAQLGKLDEELQFQQQATVDTFLTALARCRRRTRVILTVCTYYLVASFVSAMYLPIFSLGSNI